MTIERALELIFGPGGVVFLLLLVLYGGYKQWWIWGWVAKEQRDRINKLEARLDRATRAAESGTAAADRATRLAERRVGTDDP